MSVLRWPLLASAVLVCVPRFARADDPSAHNPASGRVPSGDDAKAGDDPTKNPLLINADVRDRIGSDFDGRPAPVGELKKSYFPYYEEARDDYRLRLLPPFYLEHSRFFGPKPNTNGTVSLLLEEDREQLIGLFYYRRRSPRLKADVLFPLFWNMHDGENDVTVVGPYAHREAPGESDNWLAPIVFAGSRPDGGYFHAPLLLTTSHWGKDGAFTLAGPYFRTRTGSDVDLGLAPLFFHGSSGDAGAQKSYTLIPPLLSYFRSNELENTRLSVIGPFVSASSPKRESLHLLPLFYHIHGKPETGGIRESHTTLFPLFHYGRTEEESFFVLPGYLRRVTPKSDTMLTPLFSRATTRGGRTEFLAAGPVVPLYFQYRDKDIGTTVHAVAPFFFHSESPEGNDTLTPLFGHFARYGESETTWVFPTFTFSRDRRGYENALHPLVYVGQNDDVHHTVVAPLYWDFNSPRSRGTVAFPLFWRFSDKTDDSVTQVAGNTLYMQKRVAGGLDWQFHFLPIFSYGEDPNGYFWNLVFGAIGYQKSGSYGRMKLLYVPFQVSGPTAVSAR